MECKEQIGLLDESGERTMWEINFMRNKRFISIQLSNLSKLPGKYDFKLIFQAHLNRIRRHAFKIVHHIRVLSYVRIMHP